MILLTASCSNTEWHPRPITDVSNLHGLRVGTNLAWEADYILTKRNDIELYRYDTTADMMMALNYDKIDAIAVDLLISNILTTTAEGIGRVEPSFGETGYVLFFRPGMEDVEAAFNAFVTEYRKTDYYQDFLYREKTFDIDTYEPKDIPLTGTGETLIVAALAADGYPRCFPKTDGTITGFDTEPLKMFANENNYQLDFRNVNYESAIIGLTNGTYDLVVGYISDAYKDEAEEIGLLVSEPFDITPLYFMQKTQRDITYDYTLFEE